MFEDFRILVENIVQYSRCMQYSPETKEEILELFSYNSDDDFQSKLEEWGDNYYKEDFKYLCENKGVKLEDFQLVIDAIQKFEYTFDIFISDKPIYKALSNIFLHYKYQELDKMILDIQGLINLDLLNDEYIIDRELEGDYSTGSHFSIPNPYNYLYQFESKMSDYLTLEKLSIENFVFPKELNIIPQLVEDIENSDFENEDQKALLSLCSLIILRGFLFNQIIYKLNDDEIEDCREDYSYICDMTNFTKEEVQRFSEYKFLQNFFYKLTLLLGEFDEKKISNIYSKYTDNVKRNIIKKFTTVLIPNVKNYFDPKKVLDTIFDMTDKYKKYFLHFDLKEPYIINFLFQYLPYKLTDSPGEFYDKLFKEAYTYSSCWFFKNLNEQNITVPKEIPPVTNPKTLAQQKFYIIYKLLEYAKENDQKELSVDSYIIIFSLFTWKFDVDYQKARDLEDYYQRCINCEYNVENFVQLYTEYFDFIKKKVLPAKKPLKQSEIEKNMSEQKKKSKCCDIQ